MEAIRTHSKKKVPVIAVDEEELRTHVSEVVRQSVEETLNGLLDAEADTLCQARRYERNAERASTRAGHYERNLQTKAGTVQLKVPKLRHMPFETAIIERYRRRESSVEEALVEMYLAGVSVRRVEDITEALWGSRVSPSTISDLNQKIFERVEEWRNRPLEPKSPYIFVDGIWLKRSWGGEVQNVSVLVAIGVSANGFREILGVAEGSREDTESWRQFLRYLRERGLEQIDLVVSDKSLGFLEALGEFYPDAKWQRCVVHFYRNVLHAVPRGKAKEVALMLKAVHAQEDKEAALKSMRQITGALVGVAVVICAVFVPMAFMSGSMGAIYRQFSITIVSSMVLSVLVAIILTPALCATMLQGGSHAAASGFFGRFNKWFDGITRRYAVGVRSVVRKPARWLGAYVVILVCCVALMVMWPTGFLPDEDQGILYVDVQLPPGASFERTEQVLEEIDTYFRTEEKDAVRSVMTVKGWGFSGSGQNSGVVFPLLKDWSERGRSQSAFAVMERAQARFSAMPGARIFVMIPPAVMELGNASGFDLEIMDRGVNDHAALMQAKDTVLQAAAKRPEVYMAWYSGLDDAEQLNLHVDSAKAGIYGLSTGEINTAIASYWGGEYINDFSDKGRTKKVYLQAEPAFRSNIDNFSSYYIRNAKGEMVPFSSFLTVESLLASPKLSRYQGVPSVKIGGIVSPGKSSGQTMEAMEEIVKELPAGFDHAWTGISFQERMSGNQAPLLYAVSILVVFLGLAALYESWAIPFAVIMAVPTGVIGVLVSVCWRMAAFDIYCQIALLAIVGLSAKNSILIVEFARQLYEQGKDLCAATVEAAQLRLRPIVMTSLCFILGVVPLVLSQGAGSGAQNALGAAVVAGMITATGLGAYYTPLFFVQVVRLVALFSKRMKIKS